MRNRLARTIAMTIGFIMVSIVLLPLFWMLLTSFKPAGEVIQFPPKFLFRPSSQNLKELIFETRFLTYFLNSIVVALSVVVIVDIVALIMMFLTITGFYLFVNKLVLKKSKTKDKAARRKIKLSNKFWLKWHNKIG